MSSELHHVRRLGRQILGRGRAGLCYDLRYENPLHPISLRQSATTSHTPPNHHLTPTQHYSILAPPTHSPLATTTTDTTPAAIPRRTTPPHPTPPHPPPHAHCLQAEVCHTPSIRQGSGTGTGGQGKLNPDHCPQESFRKPKSALQQKHKY